MPEVMEAVSLHGGVIRPRVAVVKSLASALCIGTGGSVGREGPIAQIGAAIGSTIGQYFKLSRESMVVLVACGTAGGIAATFNAPIAGAIFGIEVILRRLSTVSISIIVISAVTADAIAIQIGGNYRSFMVPEYTLLHQGELLLYALLGLIAGMGSVGFTRLLYLAEDLWNKTRIFGYFLPIIGGVSLGCLGMLSPEVNGFPRIFGVGYNSINDMLTCNMTINMALFLLAGKILATCITLGSGGSGGIFAPSLFMGAMLGGSFGYIMNDIFPGIIGPCGAYALVGMAAFFSGAAHAPVTAIIILFEMTGDYAIILPLMLATVISALISQSISAESIYTLKLTRRGVKI